jgi:hypothetical protein
MTEQHMAPGDQAPAGTPGSGQADGETCPVCEGTGTVIEGIGGG